MQHSAGPRRIPVRDPRTGKVEFDLEVADRAAVGVEAARLRQGQRDWAALDVDARIAVLMRWAALLDGPFRQPLIDADARERANLAKREPQRLASMQQAWEAWEATMPPIPEDATISLGYSYKDMPQR